jgi:hypothetical protein
LALLKNDEIFSKPFHHINKPPTFYPFTIKKSFSRITMRLDFPPLNALQIKGLGYFLVKEQVFHDQKVGFGLHAAVFQIFDLDRVEPNQLR